MYSLQVTTSYAESWRYNIMVTLSLQNSEGEQVGYHSAEDSPLPIDANCDEAPEGWSRRRIVAIEFEPCNKVRFYVYLLPNSIPQVTTLAGEQTVFPMQIKIEKGDKTIFAEKIEVNRFGGCGKEFVVEL
jgi:hypothetical protein